MKSYPHISLVSRLKEAARSFIAAELERRGLSDIDTSYGDILAVLFEVESVKITELAALCDRSKSTVSVTIDKLVKKGLVDKFQDERDSRAVRVRLTGDGQKLQDEFEAISRLLNEKAFAGFTDSEIAVFEALLRKSLKNF